MNKTIEQKILIRSGQFEAPRHLNKEEAYKRIMQKIDESSNYLHVVHKKTNHRLYYIISVAASIILLVSLWFWNYQGSNRKIAVGSGQLSEYRLPDGSVVTLNANSKIAYSKNKFSTDRFLKMRGEAFFDIAKGKTFTIRTSRADVQILGTSFNIFDRDEAFKVSCFTGKVLVKSGKQSVILHPSESAIFIDGKLTLVAEVNIESVSNWLKGNFSFENVSLDIVFKEIERQFSVKFVTEDMSDKYFTGSFSNKNLSDALDIVCIPMGITYEISKNNKIYIKKSAE